MMFATAFFGRQEIYELFALIALCSAVVLSIDGRNGQNLFVWLTILVDLAGVGYVLSRATERMRALSYDDPLTGALNRRWWQVALASELAEHKRTQAPLSLVLIDIDHFKAINDTKGHEGGDQFLRDAVQVFRTRTRSMDQFARLGGDEFASATGLRCPSRIGVCQHTACRAHSRNRRVVLDWRGHAFFDFRRWRSGQLFSAADGTSIWPSHAVTLRYFLA